MSKVTEAPQFRYSIAFLAIALLIFIFKIAASIVIPFVVALFIWYLINALARVVRHVEVFDRALPDVVCYVIAFAAIFGTGWLISDLVNQNIDDVIREAPKYQKSFEKIIPQIAEMLHLDHTPTLQEIFEKELMPHVDIGAVMTMFAAMLTGIAGKTLLVMFYVGFLLYEQRFFSRKLKAMIGNAEKESHLRKILHTIDTKIQKYIGVKSFVSACDSFLTYTILSLIGVDFAGFWGVMAFFLHFIPYAGSFIAITMPMIIALIQFGDVSVFLLVMVCLCVSHAFLGHILDPYLMGNNLNLSPIIIISNLAMWGMIWGIPGMFLAIPILAIVTLALSQFERTRPIAILFSKTGVIETPVRKLRPQDIRLRRAR